MNTQIVTSRELNQDIGRAKRAAELGPVIVTDRGQPSHVLLTYAEYQRLTGGARNLASALAMPGLGETELELADARLSAPVVDLD